MKHDSLQSTEELHRLAMDAGYPLPPLDHFPHNMETFKQWVEEEYNIHISPVLEGEESYGWALEADLREAFEIIIKNKQ